MNEVTNQAKMLTQHLNEDAQAGNESAMHHSFIPEDLTRPLSAELEGAVGRVQISPNLVHRCFKDGKVIVESDKTFSADDLHEFVISLHAHPSGKSIGAKAKVCVDDQWFLYITMLPIDQACWDEIDDLQGFCKSMYMSALNGGYLRFYAHLKRAPIDGE